MPDFYLEHSRRTCCSIPTSGANTDVILPFTVLRRLDAVLEPAKNYLRAADATLAALLEKGVMRGYLFFTLKMKKKIGHHY
ncbi:MAG: hypothetical protein ACXW1U_12685 [Methylobacter sp.]